MQFGELVIWGGLGLPPYRGFSSFLGSTRGETTYWHSCSEVGSLFDIRGGMKSRQLDPGHKTIFKPTCFHGSLTTPPRGQILKGWWKRWWKKTMGICSSRNSCRFEHPHFYGSSNPKGSIFWGIELHATWLQLPAPVKVALWRSGLMVLGTCRTLVMNVIGQSLGLWKCQNETPTESPSVTSTFLISVGY